VSLSVDVIDKILARHAALGLQRRPHEVLWQEIADYHLPHAAGIALAVAPGAKRTSKVYDSTAMDAADRLASNFMGGMTNQATKWRSSEFEEPLLQEDYEASVWIEDVDRRELATYGQSNAYQRFHELYQQLIVFGTGCLYVEEALGREPGFEGYNFKTLALGSYDIAEGEQGRVDTVFVVHRLTARQAVQRFGLDVLGAKVKQRLADGGAKVDEVTQYLQVVHPREDASSAGAQRQQLRLARNLPWASCVIDMEEKVVVRESGYPEFPFFVPRWSKTVDVPGWLKSSMPDSAWGFGRGHLALPHVKTLNAIVEWGLKALPLHLFPPGWTDDDSVIGRWDMTPGAMNAVRHGASVQPYQIGGNPQVVELHIEQLQQQIKDIFYWDQLQAIPRQPQKTAFEVAQIVEQLQRVMGPTFSRLTTELFDPLANRTFGIRLRAGGFLPPPQSVLEEAAQHRGRIRVKYEGPLARAQRASEVEAIQRLYGFAGQVAQERQTQEIYDTLDDDAMVRHMGDILGVPQHLFRDKRLVARLQAQRQQAAEAEAQQRAQLAASQTAKNVTPLMTQGMTQGMTPHVT